MNVSAYMVNRVHLDVLIRAGLVMSRESEVSWYHNGKRHELTLDKANETGWMLARENVRSLRALYANPADIIPDWTESYTYANPGYTPTPVEVLKALKCYVYQSCESEDWRDTEACAFIETMTGRAVSMLAGYDKAPWEWTNDKLREKGIEPCHKAAATA
jgi:hypothetical protein